MTTRSQVQARISVAFADAKWYEQMTIRSFCSKGFCVPALFAAEKTADLEDRRRDGELLLDLLLPLLPEGGGKNEEDSALPLCPPLGDDDTGLDRLPEADFVGEKHPFVKGELTAKSAASTWCGFRSTRAFASDRERFSTVPGGPCKVSAFAQYAAWKSVAMGI